MTRTIPAKHAVVPPPAKFRPAAWIAVGIGLSAGYLAVATLGPLAIGLWQDDAIYAATAKALALGRGYRQISMPEAPFQTKYPILYPVMLAPAFLLGPAYPHNRILLFLPTSMAAAIFVLLASVYIRSVLKASLLTSVLVGVFAALSPVIIGFVRYLMSEMVFAALVVAAIYLFDRRLMRNPPTQRQLGLVLLFGLLAAAAALTRSIGVVLPVVAFLTLLIHRRWSEAAIFFLVVAAILGPWKAWQGWAAQRNNVVQQAPLTRVELDYKAWLPRNIEQVARVATQNAVRSAYALGAVHLALPREFVAEALVRSPWRRVALHLICYAAVAAALAGFVLSARHAGWTLLHSFTLASAALVLVWPFEPMRFLIPFTPFIAYWQWLGLTAGAKRACTRLPARVRPIVVHGASGAIICTIAALMAYEDFRIVTCSERSYYMRERPFDWSEVRALENWLRAQTSEQAVIASARPAGLFLSTGRRGHLFWPDRDPYADFYGPDRRWLDLFMLESDSERRAVAADLAANLVPTYLAAGVTHCIVQRRIGTSAAALEQIVPQTPERFVRVFATPRGHFIVYQFRRS